MKITSDFSLLESTSPLHHRLVNFREPLPILLWLGWLGLERWLERSGEQEGTVPNSWVDLDDMKLLEPSVQNAPKHLQERRQPKSSWRQFPLVKIKVTSGW